MSKFALQARWVVPIEARPIEGGVVTLDNDRIVAVGARAESGVPVHDLGDVVLLPGLVNAHTHLEFSQCDRPLGTPGIPLPEWIRLVISNRRQQSKTSLGLALGLEQSLRAGVTTLGEIATSNLLAEKDEVAPELIAFQEVIGFSAARIDSVFGELVERLQTNSGNYQLGISPHAPYTVHPRLLEKIVSFASKRQLPVAMHLAESHEELQLIRDNRGPFRELLEERSMWDSTVFAPGLKPLDYLQVLSQSPRALVVHGNYLDQAEIDFVAERRDQMSVIYCPRTHAYFEHDQYPLQAMLNAGVQVALGTDSRASNPDLSLLAEMRYLSQAHPSISKEQILQLGTVAGVAALGLTQSVGSLAPGKLANLIAIALDHKSQTPLEAILSSEQQPQKVWLRGCLIEWD